MWGADRKFRPEGHCLVARGSDPEGQNFLSTPKTHVCFFFLYTFRFWMFYFKSSIHYHTQWCWCRTFLSLTSLWRRNDVNLTTKLHDVLYNQCKPDSREIFSSPEPKAHRWAYSIGRHPSSVRRRPSSTFSNDISSEAMKPILAIFHT